MLIPSVAIRLHLSIQLIQVRSIQFLPPRYVSINQSGDTPLVPPETPGASRPLRPFHPTMSLTNIAHLCSHLNNVNKARLSIASVPNTKLHLKLCLAFLNQGVISTVVRGGISPPPQHLLLGHPTMDDDTAVDVPSTEPVTQSNVSSRRLWLGLKYWQNEPVMGKLIPVSKPKRKINLTIPGIRAVHSGQRYGMVDGLRSPGELLFLLTNRGLMESRQCLERNVGGMVLCRMS